MRRLIVYNRLSLDGCYAGPNGEMDWFLHDPEVDKIAHQVYKADTLVFGRVTYQIFESFWGPIAADEEADPALRGMALELESLEKVVASRSLTEVSWANSRLLQDDLIADVQALKAGDGGAIAIFGSGTIVDQLTAAGLIDEYLLVVTPVICGDGKRCFDSAPLTDLRLLQTWDFESGNVLIHYARGE